MSQLENCPHCGKALSVDLKPKDRELLRLLDGKGAITPRDLAAAMDRSAEGSFDRRLTKLRQAGFIERNNGSIRCTPTGRSASR